MVTTFRKVDIEEEKDLEEAIAADPRIIEEGLSPLMHGIQLENGQLDILCLDAENTLTLIDIEIKENNLALFNALKYHDWVTTNIDAVKQMLKNDRIDTAKTPRMILIAPSFSHTITRLVRYALPRIELFEYAFLKTKSGEEGIHLKKVTGEKTTKDILVHREKVVKTDTSAEQYAVKIRR